MYEDSGINPTVKNFIRIVVNNAVYSGFNKGVPDIKYLQRKLGRDLFENEKNYLDNYYSKLLKEK